MKAAPAGGLWTGSVVLAGFVAGSALQLQQRELWFWLNYAAVIAVPIVLWALLAIKKISNWRPLRGARVLRGLFWGVGALALGFALCGLRAGAFLEHGLNPALEGRDLAVVGVVAAMPQRNEGGVRFRLDVESAALDGAPVSVPPRVLLGWYGGASMGTDGATLELQRQPADLRPGERWQMTVRLKAPHGNLNPHGFDYELWLWEQGVQATGLCAFRPERPRAATAGRDGLAPRRARPPCRARRDPGAGGRRHAGARAQRRHPGRAGHRRPGRHRARRLGHLPRHRRGAPDEHLRPAHHALRLGGRGTDRRAVAAHRAVGLAAVPVAAGAPCGADRRRGAGSGLCAVQRLGRAGTAHDLDAGHRGAAAPERAAVALAHRLAAGLRRGGGAGPMGADAGRLLAELCRGGCAVCYGFGSL